MTYPENERIGLNCILMQEKLNEDVETTSIKNLRVKNEFSKSKNSQLPSSQLQETPFQNKMAQTQNKRVFIIDVTEITNLDPTNEGYLEIEDQQGNTLWRNKVEPTTKNRKSCYRCGSKHHLVQNCNQPRSKKERKVNQITPKLKNNQDTEKSTDETLTKYLKFVEKTVNLDNSYPGWRKIFPIEELEVGNYPKTQSAYIAYERTLNKIATEAAMVLPVNRRHSYQEAYYNFNLWRGKC